MKPRHSRGTTADKRVLGATAACPLWVLHEASRKGFVDPSRLALGGQNMDVQLDGLVTATWIDGLVKDSNMA